MNAQGRLIDRFTRDLPPGTLEWIGLREERRGPMRIVDEVSALEGLGLQGDRRCQGTPDSSRQVTLISREYIGLIAHFLGHDEIAPELLRRNLVVSGINLSALRHQRFRIGSAVFEATALCHPCSRMEEVLGKGGVAAMLGHGGLCARVIRSGTILVGDRVEKC
jgi:MOSC domain-containing protein YiiM